ncbi:MAG TPA: hypothetical protein VMZ00_15600, partial [Sporichthya sp.]|nr:hypothetical protein [Sporichthya sp.]
LQKQWLQLSPTARQRVVDSTHDVVFDATDVVVEEILAALDEADFAAAPARATPSASASASP